MNMAKMRAVQVTRAGGPLELVEKEIPEPGRGQVRVKVHACGVCHSDSITKDGHMPGIQFPRVPGHEVIGVIDAVGPEVPRWRTGQRVGIGWNGGYCAYCDNCRRGDFFACQSFTSITGITYDGGYAEYLVALSSALAIVPEELTPEEAAPLMCAGLTTYNALRNSGARPGDLVLIHGIGGLGHLGVQYAAKMGFRTVAVARGKDKEALAHQLGAWNYIDSQSTNPAEEAKRLGGAKVVLATVTEASAMESIAGALGINGTLLVVGAAGDIKVSPMQLLSGKKAVRGWYSGTSIDAQDTLEFSAFSGVRSMNEMFTLEDAPAAYDRMMSGKARFRAVIRTGQ